MRSTNRGSDERPEARGNRTSHLELLPELKAWLDGELTAPRVWFVRAHLWVCPACREEVRWLKRLGEDMRDIEKAVPSPRLRARILAALPDTPPGRPISTIETRWRISRYVTAGALACASIVGFAAIIKNLAPKQPHIITQDARPSYSVETWPSDPTLRASGPSDVTSTAAANDQYSVIADREFQKWQQDQEQRQSRQLASNRKNWNTLIGALLPARASGRSGEPLTLNLAVPDLNDAEGRLAAWARSIGGSDGVRFRASGPGSTLPPTVTGMESPSGPVTGAEPVGGRLVTVRVPATRVASLQLVLKQIGAWDGKQHAVSFAAPGASTVLHAPPIVRPKDLPAARGYPALEPGGAPSGVMKPGLADQSSARDSGPTLVTLQFHLASLESPAP